MTQSDILRLSQIPEADARSELKRLLADPRFRATERTKNILLYLANRYFEGCEDSVKAYVIALDVLGRAPDFDAAIDPIVRIEISRLRSALAQYYEAYGNETDIAIELPKGKYVTAFSRTDTELQGRIPIPYKTPEEMKRPEKLREADIAAHYAGKFKTFLFNKRKPIVLILLSLIFLSAVPIWLSRSQLTKRPTVILTMTSPQPELAGDASVTRDMLMTALTQFRTLSIANRVPETGLFGSSGSNVYTVELKYYGDNDGRSVWWQIINFDSTEVLKAGLERVNTDGRSALAVRNELVQILASRLATRNGTISTLEMQNAKANALGNICVLRAETDMDDGRIDDLSGAISCLERTIAQNPNDSDAIAALSRALITQTPQKSGRELQQRALELAHRAVSLSPLSDRAQIALMIVQFYSGMTQAAISAGNRAHVLNPINPDVVATLGFVLFVSGYWNAGVSLANDAKRAGYSIPREAAIVLALDAYRREDWSSALLLSEQINNGGMVVGMLRVASLAELESPDVSKRLADLRSINPDFERDYEKLMATQRYDNLLVTSIGKSLVKAGARIELHSLSNNP